MGQTSDNYQPATQNSNGGASRWLLPVVIAVGAAGMGVTGTLLWMENMPASPTPASTQQTPAITSPEGTPPHENAGMPGANIPGAVTETPHEPPANLTAGMTPVQTSLTLGNWYYDHKAWSQAVQQYQKTIAQGLDNSDVRTDLGSALRFSGEPFKALDQYRLAQKKNPRHENSLFNQGGVYASELKQSAKAIAVWREYIKRFPRGQSVSQARRLIAREQAKLKK